MKKDGSIELWQLKSGLHALLQQLNSGVDHLDDLTAKTIARALGELLQETLSLPDNASPSDIQQLVQEILVGTDTMKEALAEKWRDELQPLMWRAQERASQLDHQLAEFTCLSVNGEKWGAICVKCLEWIIVSPEETRGALLNHCRGWLVSWKT